MKEDEAKDEAPEEALPEPQEAKDARPGADEPKDTPPSVASVAQEVEALGELLEEERKKSEELLTRLMYLQADYDNLRKRAEREADERVEAEMEKAVSQLLPVLDELEMATTRAEDMDKGVSEGLRMILKKFRTILERMGLKQIEAIGREFDPNLHEAVAKGISGTIVAEIRKGYLFREKVLRSSVVKLSEEDQEVVS